MRDRLIDILWNTVAHKDEDTCDYVEWLADELLGAGVIAPPCKIGDTLYYPAFGIDRVLSYKVISIKLNSKGLYVVCENCLSKAQMTHRATQIGETIFITKAEAERTLAERRRHNE